MYHKVPSFVLGFHSTDEDIALKLLTGETDPVPSKNPYDWLGDGIYFWEHNPLLAVDYAKRVRSKEQKAKAKIEKPFVIGAVIDLKNCLNLTEYGSLQILRKGYKRVKDIAQEAGISLPKNKGGNRALDCSVIKAIHQFNKDKEIPQYDSIRGAFIEGKEIYPGTEMREKNHIQICIRNPECILGYFLPRPISKYNSDYYVGMQSAIKNDKG